MDQGIEQKEAFKRRTRDGRQMMVEDVEGKELNRSEAAEDNGGE